MTNTLSTIIIASFLGLTAAFGEGFTDAHVTFYGQVRQVSGANTQILQSGELELAFGNQSKTDNRISMKTELAPVGAGDRYSYSLNVPIAYLPAANRSNDYLAIKSDATDFRIESITIDGKSATLPDGSSEFFALSFANRADQIRLDLIVDGDSTDSDGDGLPDWWERLHGLDASLANANADTDGDGWTNIEEFRRGSDPSVSDLAPSLATTELRVPELGEAGCYLHINDSNTIAEEILINIDAESLTGFEIRRAEVPFSGEIDLASIQAGELTIAHVDRRIREAVVPVTWSDGGEAISGNVRIMATHPSTSDGNDASLWLDAASLTQSGPLGSWPDRSGNDRHATQPLAEHQPEATDRGVDFSKPNSHLFFHDNAFPSGDHTLLAAWQTPESSPQCQTLLATNLGFLRLESTTDAVSYPGAPVYQADDIAVRGYESTLGGTSISTFRREGETLQNVYGLSFNGEETEPESLSPVLATIGARRSASANAEIVDGFAGQLLELFVFPTALPEQKLRDVHDYLKSKWHNTVVWDFSTGLRPVTLTAAPDKSIVRGGHGNDDLSGTIISGGPGDDVLRGGDGSQTFVFGGVDTGKDTILDFDPNMDVIDLSALFWGQTGDARNHIRTRLDTDLSTAIPTLNTTLIVSRPDTQEEQEILLRNVIVSDEQLIQMIVEGTLRMGGLSIPTSIGIVLSQDAPSHVSEIDGETFEIELTRSGAGTAAALDVPLGFFNEALGHDFILEEAIQQEGQRAVIAFTRGETSRTITVRPIADLQTEGSETWELAVLPQFRYEIAEESPVEQRVHDVPLVSLTTVQPHAVPNMGQEGVVRIQREGDTTNELRLPLTFSGTAEADVHFEPLPDEVTIPRGQQFALIRIRGIAEALTDRPRKILVALDTGEHFLAGTPNQAQVTLANSISEANKYGFNAWLAEASDGVLRDLTDIPANDLAGYVKRYANARQQLTIHLQDDRPELKLSGTTPADIQWRVFESANLETWADASTHFSRPDALTFLGEPVQQAERQRFFRLKPELIHAVQWADRIGHFVSDVEAIGVTGTWHSNIASDQIEGRGSIIVEVDGITDIAFEMLIPEGAEASRFSFSIDGEVIANVSGENQVQQISRRLEGEHVLQWRSEQASGAAIIRNITH